MTTEMIPLHGRPTSALRGGAVAIGNFDGVHHGHLALLAELRCQAQQNGGPAVAITFDPHPLQLLRPELFQPVLTTVADRAALLEANGADHVLILGTSPELLHLTAREFFDQVIKDRLGARTLVEGPNFGFGRGREGTIETLTAFCQQTGVGLVVVPPLQIEGAVVSSSRVRAALVKGDAISAAKLLGRPYRLRGTVGTGQRRGQRLGFPTANLQEIRTLVPGNGVYAARVLYRGGHWPGAVNIGPNPTFGEQSHKVEVHLVGFEGDLVSRELALDFLSRLRDTRPFPSVDQLIEQLHLDVAEAKRLAQTSL
jgi:riboflavin kinase/FMN adenylyltransferase